MSNELSRAVIGALMLTLAGPLLAAEAKSSAPDGITVGELSQVQSETILYKAQVERAKALRELNGDGAQAATATQPRYLPQPVATPGNRMNGATEQGGAVEQLPVVKLVYSAGHALHATLLYSGGFEIDASLASTDLPGGYRVASLSLDSVVLSKGGRRFPLGFSNRPPSYPVAAAPQASPLPVTFTPMTSTPPVPVEPPSPIALPGSLPTDLKP